MFNVEGSRQILEELCKQFGDRLQSLKDLYSKVNSALAGRIYNEKTKTDKKINKYLEKTKKYCQKQNKKFGDKQMELLNSNHLDKLEKDILESSKLLNEKDDTFLYNVEVTVTEAVQNDAIDELSFCVNFLQIWIDATEFMYLIFYKQLAFINSVFNDSQSEIKE